MTEKDPQELTRALEREADELAQHGQEVQDAVKHSREDWERKRRDEKVPGAPPPEGQDSPADADAEPPPEARREG